MAKVHRGCPRPSSAVTICMYNASRYIDLGDSERVRPDLPGFRDHLRRRRLDRRVRRETRAGIPRSAADNRTSGAPDASRGTAERARACDRRAHHLHRSRRCLAATEAGAASGRDAGGAGCRAHLLELLDYRCFGRADRSALGPVRPSRASISPGPVAISSSSPAAVLSCTQRHAFARRRCNRSAASIVAINT